MCCVSCLDVFSVYSSQFLEDYHLRFVGLQDVGITGDGFKSGNCTCYLIFSCQRWLLFSFNGFWPQARGEHCISFLVYIYVSPMVVLLLMYDNHIPSW